MAASGSNPDETGTISEINITPFVDVVLVLLIIFMVTAPALMKDIVGLQLPKAASSDQKAVSSLGISVTRQGQFLLNGNLITIEQLIIEVRRAKEANPETQAIIAADEEARHGDVVKAIDAVKTAGVSKFAFQIQKPR